MTGHPVIAALVLLALTMTAGAFDTQRIDRLVQHVMRCTNTSALGLALVDLNSNNMYSNAYGMADPSNSVKADDNTRFCLGGATEAFTAVLLAKLLHENENVTWTTPIQEIVGHRVSLSDAYRSENLNLKDILAQRTGYPNMDIVPVVEAYSPNELARKIRYVQPVAGFREKFVPNQILFSVLDEVLKGLANDTWQDLIKEHILDPLLMKSVIFLGSDDHVTGNVAHPVVFYNKKPKAITLDAFKGQRLVKQASSICMSPADMAIWIRFLMRGKAANSEQLVDMDVLAETFKGVQIRAVHDYQKMTRNRPGTVQMPYSLDEQALGWITGQYRGYGLVSQSGSLPGAQTLGTVLPLRKVAVLASFTGQGGGKGFAAKVIINMIGLDFLMEGKSALNENNVCSTLHDMAMQHSNSDGSMDKHQGVRRTGNQVQEGRTVEDYTGYYRNYAFGDILVKYNETGKQGPGLYLAYGKALYRMYPINYNDTFELFAQHILWNAYDADEKNAKTIAVFSEDPRDPERRLRDVMISGFDKTGDVLFSKNPTPPRFTGFHPDHWDCQCGASSLTSAAGLLVGLLFVSITVSFR